MRLSAVGPEARVTRVRAADAGLVAAAFSAPMEAEEELAPAASALLDEEAPADWEWAAEEREEGSADALEREPAEDGFAEEDPAEERFEDEAESIDRRGAVTAGVEADELAAPGEGFAEALAGESPGS